MCGLPLNPCISEDARLAALGNPIAANKTDRDVLELGPTLNGLGGIAFGGHNYLIGQTPGFYERGQNVEIEIITTNIATCSENA